MAAKKTKKPRPSILMHAGSDDPDMLYFSRFHAPDPYLAFTAGRRKIALASVLEFGRMQRESDFDEVLLLPDVQKAAAKRFRLPKGELAGNRDVVRHLAKEYGIREFLIGDRF